MISIRVHLDDLLKKKVGIQKKHLVRPDLYRHVSAVRGISSMGYYTRNYNHGRSSQQMREKNSNDRNELYDLRRESNSKVYCRDYNHGSSSNSGTATPSEKAAAAVDKDCQFYRRNYFQPSKSPDVAADKAPSAENSCSSARSGQGNPFTQNSEDRARSFVGTAAAEPKSDGNVLRPAVLPIDTERSFPRIREIVTLSNPLLSVVRCKPVPGTATTAAARNVVEDTGKPNRAKKPHSRREMKQMRKKIAELTLQSKSTSEPSSPSKPSSPSAAAAAAASPPPPTTSTKPRASTATSSTQTANNEPASSLISMKDMNKLIDIYRCEKCRSLCLPELYECGAGHAVCEECWLSLSRCPGVHEQGHNAGGFRRGFGLERLAGFLRFPCRWQEDGCEERLAPERWRDHAANCDYYLGRKAMEAVSKRERKQRNLVDSGLDSDDDVVIILDDDYEFMSGEE